MTTVEREGDKAGCDYCHTQTAVVNLSFIRFDRKINDAYKQARIKKARIVYDVLLYGVFIEHF